VLSDHANIPISRAAMKRKNQKEGHHPVVSASSSHKRSTTAPRYKTQCARAFEFFISHLFFFLSFRFLPTTPLGEDDGGLALHPTTRHALDDALAPSAGATLYAQKQLLWAKVLTAKTLVQNSNVTIRMAKMEELKNAADGVVKRNAWRCRRVGLRCGGEEFVGILPSF
jgi:hypothetical protein